MLIIPMTNKLNWKNPPVITLSIILITVFVFFAFQGNDHQRFIEAEEYYLKSGLAAIEVPYYIDFINPTEKKSFSKEKGLNEKKLYEHHLKMELDFEFLGKLKFNEIILEIDPKFSMWKEMRAEYESIRDKSISFKYGFKPAYFEPVTLFTSMFLHGSFGHLLSNMIFLWIVGCILEAGCGRFRYAVVYIITGVCAQIFFKLIYFSSTIPLIGASGAIAGLMGMLALLFGKKTIKVFYSLGFFFDYIRIRAIFLFFLWIGNELIQLFWGQASNVAYVAHIGGLLSGGLCALILLKIPNAVDHAIFENEVKDIIGPMIEEALEKIARLDMDGGRKILYDALKKDPNNLQVLIQLFRLYKQEPEKQEFHEICERMISSLIKKRENYSQANELFKEYQDSVRTIKLSSRLLVGLCFVLCELNNPEKAGKIIIGLIKKNKNLPGLPTALMKISFAFKKKGNNEHFKKCQAYLCAKYPHANEASLILNSMNPKTNIKS